MQSVSSSSSSETNSEEERKQFKQIESEIHSKLMRSFGKAEPERILTASEEEREIKKAEEWKEKLDSEEHDMILKLQEQQNLPYLRTDGSIIKKQEQIDLENELERQEIERTAMQNAYDDAEEELVLEKMKDLSISNMTQEIYEDIKHWVFYSGIEREHMNTQWIEKFLSLHEECGTREELLFILKDCGLI